MPGAVWERQKRKNHSLAAIAALWMIACGQSGGSSGRSMGGPGTGGAGTAGAPSAGAPNAGGRLLETSAGGSTACERVVEFQALTLAEPPPFDVIIVADHSDSLSWSRDDLARGLATLLDNLKGRDVRVFVLTPTQYGASTEAAEPWLWGSALISWKDPVTGTAYPNPMTEYGADCTTLAGVPIACPEQDPGPGADLIVEGHWDFQMPAPVAVIQRGMTDAELTEATAAVSSAILGLGGGGAQVEQPLCTLGRYVTQSRDLLPEHAVFLVISDEDDTTDGRGCLVGHTTSYAPGNSLTECATDCDEYRASMSTSGGMSASYGLDCVPVDDFGTPFPDEAVHRSFFTSGACTNPNPHDCSELELVTAARQCAPGSVVQNCTAQCATGSRSCLLTRTENTNLCSQSFEEQGVTYANFRDYCSQTTGLGDWNNCYFRGFNRIEGPPGGMVPHRLVTATDTQQLIDHFHRQAENAFGTDGYKVQAIILDPAFPCQRAAGQSYGTNLRKLASSPEDVFAICEPYDRALTSVEGFAQELIQTEYPLVIESDEEVTSVEVIDRDGERRSLPPGSFDHDPDAGLLTLSAAALTAGDAALDVEIIADCRPR